jgi:hypothetical protein
MLCDGRQLSMHFYCRVERVRRTACAPALLGSLTRYPGGGVINQETDDEEEWPAGSAMHVTSGVEQVYGTRDKTPSFQVSSSQKVQHFLQCCPVSVTHY